ncbi:carboxypeptidase regulatory-like domain-containing protein [Natrialba swarupiae]|uniref:Carboxypeptidase regulatory-like domain-containing protein n=1 Tax=Natrialba swarupiae TaxID=2448032 RepID=A0A5D5AIQ4_9EURY|nr:carboxypeptidase regulatory-like domain-containing protein [Natrialba swarupiae]TYT60895.1 carboxypeptidase regulatory-like domain-containing protein [Natrialba swarupiae]
MRIERSLVLEGVPREVPVDTPITVCVRDRANRPVEGAIVDLGTRRVRTNARGRCEITVRSPGFWKIVAEKAPTDRVVYEPATALVRAVPRTNHRRTRVERSRKPLRV